MDERIEQIAMHFGKQTQDRKIAEEFCECLVSIALGDKKEIVGEIADCFILLLQQSFLNDITEGELEEAIESKLARTMERIIEGYYVNNKKN